MKVIFVSNSPVVLNKKLGSKIDQFDIVIRCNDFEIDGYEEYVGTKTDIWASCSAEEHQKDKPIFRIWHWLEYQKNKLGPFKEIWTVRERKGDNLFLDNQTQIQNFITNETKFRFMEKRLIDGKLDYVSEFKRENCSRLNPASNGVVSPGTGFLTILTALETFGEITLYGNSFFKDKHSMEAKQNSNHLGKHYFTMDIERYKNTEREGYFQNQLSRETGSPTLDYDTETKIIEEYIKQDRIKILT